MSDFRRREQKPIREGRPFVTGPICAAVLAGGIFFLTYAIFVDLAEAFKGFGDLMNLYDPVGPLAGKTTFPLIIFFVSWAGLHFAWKNKDVNFRRVFYITLLCLAILFIATFPPFFELFAAG